MEAEGFHGDFWQPEQENKRRSRKEDDNLEDEEEVGREESGLQIAVDEDDYDGLS